MRWEKISLIGVGLLGRVALGLAIKQRKVLAMKVSAYVRRGRPCVTEWRRSSVLRILSRKISATPLKARTW